MLLPPLPSTPAKKQLQLNSRALLFPNGHGNPDEKLPFLRSPYHSVPPGWLCSRRYRTGAPTARPAAPAAAPVLPAGPIAHALASSGLPGHRLPPPRGSGPAASSHIGEHPATKRGDTLSPAAKCPCGPCGWVLIVAAKTVTFSHLLWCFTHSLFPQEKVPWMMQALRGARGKAVGEGPSGPACSFRASPGPRAGAEAPQNLRDSFVSEQGSFFKGF